MKVILQETLDNLGSIGEVVRVSAGYARNFLLPRKLATLAGEGQVAQLEHQKRQLQKKIDKIRGEKEVLKKEMEQLSIAVRRKAGENNKLFGSVTNQDVMESLREKGYKVDKKQIELTDPIKKLGNYKVALHLMEGVTAQINVAVIADVE